jgi:hypothetical protein
MLDLQSAYILNRQGLFDRPAENRTLRKIPNNKTSLTGSTEVRALRHVCGGHVYGAVFDFGACGQQ